MLHWGKTLAVAGAMGLMVTVGDGVGNAAPLGTTIDRAVTKGSLVVPVHDYDGPVQRYGDVRLPYYPPVEGLYGRPHYRSYEESYRKPHWKPHYRYYEESYRRPYYAPYVAHYATPYHRDFGRERIGHPHDVARCAAIFRSFSYRTGTYVTYDGEVRICPFLD